MKLVSVTPDQLKLGMYVAKLDRPWLETPFLFQGFRINSDKVIAEIRRYCNYVYIDAEQSPEPASSAAPETPGTVAARPRRHADTASVGGGPGGGPAAADNDAAATVTAPRHNAADVSEVRALQTELPEARIAQQKTEEVFTEAVDRLKQGKRIDLSQLGKSLDLVIASVARNQDAIAWVTRMKKKNDYLFDHSVASSVWAVLLGQHLNLKHEALQVFSVGALLMDVGKTRIDDALLVKRDPSPDELQTLRGHVELGVEIVSAIPRVNPRIVEIVSCHHERYDGSGYPRGLSGRDIPLLAQLAGVIDSYDAMTQTRPYRDPMSTLEATQELNRLAGSQFSEQVVSQLVQAIGVFPVGTLVELSSGEVAVVIAQHKTHRLQPKVMLLLDPYKEQLDEFPVVDLRHQSADAGDRLHIRHGLPPGAYGIDPTEYYL